MGYMKKNMYGNGELVAFFEKEIENSRLAHAYIIEGVRGSGRYTLVKSILADLCEDERCAGLVLNNTCADVVSVEPEEGKKTIQINAVRQIRESAYIKPNDLEFKAYIIRPADVMTTQAQNALLKLLEEPPKNVYFFLICENSALLLPTVRSRAPVIRMQSFSNEELREYLLEKSPRRNDFARLNQQEMEHVLCLSGGSIGKALEDLEENGDDKEGYAEEVISLLEHLFQKKKNEVFLTFSSPSIKRQEMLMFVSRLQLACRDMAATKQRGNNDMLFGYRDKIVSLAKKYTLAQILACYGAASKAEADLSANMNVSSVKSVLTFELWKAVC